MHGGGCVGYRGIMRPVVIRAVVSGIVVVVAVGLKGRLRQLFDSGFPLEVSHLAIKSRLQIALCFFELLHGLREIPAEFGQLLRTEQKQGEKEDEDEFLCTSGPIY